MKATLFSTLILCVISISVSAQSSNKFPAKYIDSTIVEKRQLHDQINMLVNECNWKSKIGKRIDVFWLSTIEGDRFGLVYEYFMDCDNLRLIYWYDNPQGTGKMIDFMIENLEDPSDFVTDEKKHLKNKKKYHHLVE